MVAIWSLVALNWLVRCLLGSPGFQAVLIGHSLVALTLASFARVTGTHPGTLPANFPSDAPPPPRSYFLKRTQETVLGFDHNCFWLGCPIGLYNRRFFLQFMGWAWLLSLFGLVLAFGDVQQQLPWLFYSASDGASIGDELRRLLRPENNKHDEHAAARLHAAEAFLAANPSMAKLYLSAEAFNMMSVKEALHAAADLGLVFFDLWAVCFLGAFAAWQASLVLRNKTTNGVYSEAGSSEADEAKYDLGPLANWRQVFGARWWLWPWPLRLHDAPQVDGLSAWPTNSSS